MKNKKLLIITSLIALLPIVFGLVFWNQLPGSIATHFGADNEPNGWSSKIFTVFGMPVMMCALHVFCIVMTMNDPKRQNINAKLISIVYWIIPVTSLVTMAMIYANALGTEINILFILSILIGAMLIILGNYMPKARQNFTVGIKTPWALNSEENWNRSNRFGGWVYMAAGLIFMANAFSLSLWLLLATVIIAGFLPMIYSFYLYKKGI